jgi:hypothetical protein
MSERDTVRERETRRQRKRNDERDKQGKIEREYVIRQDDERKNSTRDEKVRIKTP